MASSVLYPPIIESYFPAFPASDGECSIDFSISKFNASKDFKNVHVVIYKQDSGLNVVNKELEENNNNQPATKRYGASGIIINMPYEIVDSDNKIYRIKLKNKDVLDGWQVGWIYKIQLRLSESIYDGSIGQTAWLNANANNFSEWSTVSIIKATGTSSLKIPNYDAFTTIDNFNFVGSYNNTDKSENLYSYRVKLYDEALYDPNNLMASQLEDSGYLYANQYENINQISYNFKTEPESNKNYKVRIEYETINKYTGEANYELTSSPLSDKKIDISLLTVENDVDSIMQNFSSVFIEEEEGRIGLKLYSTSTNLSDSIMIRRADSRDNFKTWTDIKFYNFNQHNINVLPIFYDYTIESGVWYKYGVQYYNKTGDTIIRGPLKVIENPVMRNFSYSFLLGPNNQQLKLQFNNNLSGFKINLNETKSLTIGGKYPFIVRNGATNFKTFSIDGLISFNMDENGLFLTKEQAYHFQEVIQLYEKYNQQHGISHYDYIYEREFRNTVINFLYEDSPKLFKSPTEGNILVRLMDIDLSPEQTLNRIIYSFSASANEIADNTMENYKKYNLYDVEGVYKYE